MSESITTESVGILNYLAFFILYIICFVFIYKKNTEYIGFTVLLVINIAVMLYTTSQLMDIFQRSKYFVEMIASFSVIVGIVFHTILIIFILMVANNLNSKNIKKYGTPFILPEKYKKKLELIKRLMISSFCLGSVILFVIFNYNNRLNTNFLTIITKLEFKTVFESKTLFLTLAASLALIGISAYQIFEGDGFSKLSRQQLMDKEK
uniref:Uncharacterized protein n=1 Tax=viral metagenome TaxID=1070528 RepID=A0A6C0DEG4_9ZZZZ